jgi:release factor glutamine methyltransferase
MKTVLETITDGAGYLAKRGVENPRLNMEHLLAHVLKAQRMQLYLWFDRPLSETELAPLRDLTRRRAAREPLQHILGSVEFMGHTFLCDARGLIPRPETEELAERLMTLGKSAPPSSILDVGTGSGVLGLSLAKAFPQANVTLLDISPAALALATENAEKLGLIDPSQRVKLLQSDLFSAVAGQKFQWIVANLPYISPEEIRTLSAEVQRDPVLALDGGGPTGIDLYLKFAAQTADFLLPGGQLALEIGPGQGPALVAALQANGCTAAQASKDLQGRERFVYAKALDPAVE